MDLYSSDALFEVVYEADIGGGYDWDTIGLLQRKSDSAFFIGTDSGCSCSGFGEFLTEADLIPVWSAAQVRDIASKHWQESYYNQGTVMTEIHRLTEVAAQHLGS